LHVLVEQRVITRKAALSAIESVLELTAESAEATTNEIGGSLRAQALIETISATFDAKD
jgi:hypothetical protein